MRKRLIAVFMVLALATLIAGCIEVSEIEYVEFDTYPKTTYLIGEDLETFYVVYKLKNEATIKTLSSDDDQVKKIGFSTDNPGTFTMRVYIEGYEGVSINFVYTVVNSMIDTLFAGGYGTEEEPYQIETPQQLSNIRLALDQHFVLNNDIDLSGIDWTPIGEIQITVISESAITVTVKSAFSGTLSGNGNTLKIFARGLRHMGIFAAITGKDALNPAIIENLKIDFDIDVDTIGIGLTYSMYHTHVIDVDLLGEIKSGSTSTTLAVDAQRNIVENSTNSVDFYIKARNVNSTIDHIFVGGFFVQVTNGTAFINSSNSGDIVFEYRSSGMLAPETDRGTIAGVFVAQVNVGLLTITTPTNSGHIIGNTIANYDFYGYNYDSNGNVNEEPLSHESHNQADIYVGRRNGGTYSPPS